MKKTVDPKIKIVDDFFEIPDLWRDFALSVEYETVSHGFEISKNINDLDYSGFHSIAKKLSEHSHFRSFPFLESKFSISTNEYRDNGIYNESSDYNVGALIFLNPRPEKNSGVTFYKSSDRGLRKSVTVENLYNRCILYDPGLWMEHGNSFGTSKETGRLIIKIIGIKK